MYKYLLLGIILLVGCTPTGQSIVPLLTDEGGVEAVYFCPQDNCTEGLAEFISSAEESVHCAFFDLDLPDIDLNLGDMKMKDLDLSLEKKNPRKKKSKRK